MLGSFIYVEIYQNSISNLFLKQVKNVRPFSSDKWTLYFKVYLYLVVKISHTKFTGEKLSYVCMLCKH
jgi:hypothetical protein